MKIKNNTHWRTDQLRAIISRVVKDELDAAKRAKLIVTICYTRRLASYSSGCAHVGGNRMQVNISKHAQHVDKVDFAATVAHEAAHIRGMQHSQMGFPYRESANRIREYDRQHEGVLRVQAHFAWANDYPIELPEKKAKPSTSDVQEKRYANVLSLQKAWATKLKRAQTALRKLRTKQRYYERAFAAQKPKGSVSGM